MVFVAGSSCEGLVHTSNVAAGAATAVRLCCSAGCGAAAAGLLDHMVTVGQRHCCPVVWHDNGVQPSQLPMPMHAVCGSSGKCRTEQIFTCM